MSRFGLKVLFSLLFCYSFILVHSQESTITIDKRPAKSVVKVDKRDRIDMAIEQEFEMTQDPALQAVPRYRMKEARGWADSKRKDMKSAISNVVKSGILGIQWEERGPNNVGGRTRSILVDKSDISGNTVFAGSVAGGLWKTTKANLSNPEWEKVDDFLDNLAISAIVQDPQDFDILYLSTGEGFYNIDAIQGNGVYKSTDHGLTWNLLMSTDSSPFYYTQSMEINNLGWLFVGTKTGGLQRSIDGGISFDKVLGSSLYASLNTVSDIEIAYDGAIYVSMGLSDSDGIYKSTDNGDTWGKLSNGLPSAGFSRIKLACAKSNSEYIYAVLNDKSTGNCLGVFRSTDSGLNWVEIDNPNMIGNSNFLRKQGWYNMALAIDPNDESVVYLGGIDLFKSVNAGMNFNQISQWYGGQNMEEVHADQHIIVFGNEGSDVVYFGNDGGVFRSSNATSTNIEINSINTGYNVTQFYAADFHPDSNSEYISAGAQDNGTQFFSESGMNATQELTGGDGGFTHFDQTNGDILISSYIYNNFRVSDDMGNDFTYRSFGNQGRFINPSDYDDVNQTIYSGNKAGFFFRWLDPAEKGVDTTYVELSGLGSSMISAIKVSPNQLHRIYVGTGAGRLLRVDDAHEGNQLEGELLFEGVGYISSISIELMNEAHLLITLSNYGIESVFESQDGGGTWVSIEGDLPDMPVRWGMFNPHDPSQVLLATELGVWSTSYVNGKSTRWTPSNSGLANVRTDMISVRSSDNMLLAATHGRGVFTSDFFAVPQMNFELDSITKYESAELLLSGSCPKQYSLLTVPVFMSSIPNGTSKAILNVVGGSAMEHLDFELITDTVTFDSDHLKGEFVIRIFDDSAQESKESIELEILAVTGLVGNANHIVVTIVDDDPDPSTIDGVNLLQIGYDDIGERNAPFKSYYEDERTQYIYTAEELLSSGLVKGKIIDLALNIIEKNSTDPFSGFTIKIGETELNTFDIQNPEFESSPSLVVYSDEIINYEGWNTFTFSEAIDWDGMSNLLIEICFNNSDYSIDDKVESSSIGEYRSQYRYMDGGDGCNLSATPFVKMVRPNMRFSQQVSLDVPKTSYTIYSQGEESVVNNYYDSNQGIIASVEHSLGNSSSCFETSLTEVGDQKLEVDWLDNGFLSQKQYYFSSPESFEGGITLYYSVKELIAWENPYDLHVLRTDSKVSKNQSSTYDVINNNVILIYNINDSIVAFSFLSDKLGGFALTDVESLVVPVELVEFTAIRYDRSNLLKWKVEAEVNLDEYVVERSFDGSVFEEIGTVSGSNKVVLSNEYQFLDADLFFLDKNYYYRLKIQDQDGTYKYSEIVAVFVKGNSIENIQVYPNPFFDELHVKLESKVSHMLNILLLDTRGNVIMEMNLDGASIEQKLYLRNLAAGVYVLQVVDTVGDHYEEVVIKR